MLLDKFGIDAGDIQLAQVAIGAWMSTEVAADGDEFGPVTRLLFQLGRIIQQPGLQRGEGAEQPFALHAKAPPCLGLPDKAGQGGHIGKLDGGRQPLTPHGRVVDLLLLQPDAGQVGQSLLQAGDLLAQGGKVVQQRLVGGAW